MTDRSPLVQSAPAEPVPAPASTAEDGDAAANGNLAARLGWVTHVIARRALYVGLAVIILFFCLKAPNLFPTLGNVRDIALSGSILLIIAVPQALLVIMGYVDLSVGSMLGLAGVVAGMLINDHVNTGVAILAALAVGAVGGALNGVLVSYTRLSPIIITLGTLQLFRGVAQLLTQNPPSDFGHTMALLGRGIMAGIPVPVWIAAAVLLLGFAFLSGSPSGRHTYAVGVNKEAAYLSGVAVKRLPFLVFVITGVAAGLGGVLYAARLDAAPPGTLGSGFELDVLTAVLLGGIAFSGGRGTMGGVLLGVVFIGVLRNGMLLLNVSFFWQEIATGAALIFAAALDELAIRPGRVRRLARTGRTPERSPSRN